MENSVDHMQAGPAPANRCPHCHASMSARKRSWADVFNSLFYWALIFFNIVVLVLGVMDRNDPPYPCEEDPHCWSDPTMPKIDFITLETSEPPKEVLERDFPDLPPLPIRGGWGYDMETACIIETPDDPDFPLDGVDVEYAFAEHRLYEELMFMRPFDDEGYEDINFTLTRQMLRQEGDRYFDVLTFQVSARVPKWTDPFSPSTGSGKRRPARLHTGEREFWFDITSFYGKYGFDDV